METATLEYDGTDVRDDAYVGDGELTYRPTGLEEGTHTLRFSIDQPLVPWRATRSWSFTVDHTRPDIEITGPTRPAVREAPVTLSGRVNEPSTVTVDDAPVEVAGDGSFSVTFPEPPAGKVSVRAVDRAGNSSGIRTTIPVIAREPLVPTRAVHMTAISWQVDYLREPVLDLLRDKRINAIQLDLKDESGVIGYDSELPFANQIGAVDPSYVLEDAVRQIHDLGGRVVGRIVAFRDPILAKWAWDHQARDAGHPDARRRPVRRLRRLHQLRPPRRARLQHRRGRGGRPRRRRRHPLRLHPPPGRPARDHEVPGAEGRRPGARSSPSWPRRATACEPTGAFLGASLFGIAAFRPEEVAQDVSRIARNVNYVAPLVYPSHWGPRRLRRRRARERAAARSSSSRWSTSTSWWRTRARASCPGSRTSPCGWRTGPRRCARRSRGPSAEGISEWIMWDPNVTYTRAACLKA